MPKCQINQLKLITLSRRSESPSSANLRNLRPWLGLEMADPAAAGLGDSISTVRTQRATNELTEETNLFKTALIIKASDPNTARPPP